MCFSVINNDGKIADNVCITLHQQDKALDNVGLVLGNVMVNVNDNGERVDTQCEYSFKRKGKCS